MLTPLHPAGQPATDSVASCMQEDRRPAFVLDDVSGADFQHVKAQKVPSVSTIVLKNVENFTARGCTPLPDTQVATADRREM